MAVDRSGSLLAADFGSVYTRVTLMDVVDGVYHLIGYGEARSTAGYPISDVNVGFDHALADLSEKARRKLVGDNGRLIMPEKSDRSGVDYFVATASLGRPLQTVVVGLIPDVSIASAIRAASGTYINIVETISLDDGRSEEDRLNAILLSRPDLILITGGTDKGAREPVLALAKVVRLAVSVTNPGHKPTILYAGNTALHEPLQALFGKTATVFLADNVRPTLEDEDLDSALAQLGHAFDEFKERRGEGFRAVSEISNVGVLPTAQSYSLITEYLCRSRRHSAVLAVDVGSAVSVLATGVDERVSTSIRTDIGLGHSAAALVETVGVDAIRAWAPFRTTETTIANYAANKTLRPGTIPATLRELYLEHAMLRAGIRHMLRESGHTHGRWEMIIGSGSALTRTGNRGFTALLLLDAIQPNGVTALYADTYGLLPALGAAAAIIPAGVVQMLDGRDVERLGTSISVSGQPRPGKPAVHVKLVVEGEVFEHDIEGGHLWVLPLGTGKRLEVQLSVVGRGLHIGGKRRLKMTFEGGAAGLIFDARGRSLPLAADARGLAAQLPQWVSEATGDPLLPIDESWLVEVAEEIDRPITQPRELAARPQPARGRRATGTGRLAAARGKAAMPEEQQQDGDQSDDLRRELSE